MGAVEQNTGVHATGRRDSRRIAANVPAFAPPAIRVGARHSGRQSECEKGETRKLGYT
jgi:hypothetical protein